MRRLALAGLAAALLVAAAPGLFAQSLRGVRKEFAEIGDMVVPATVTLKAPNLPRPTSSGVIVHPEGYVLSDADATLVSAERGPDGELVKRHGREAIVRLPPPDSRALRAVLVWRDPETDTTLLKINDPIEGKLPVVPVGSSDALNVGSFTIVVGNTFGAGQEGEPSLSMGIVSGLVKRQGDGGGRYETLYTSATVVQGSNGGPCVDAEGRIVGIVSTFDNKPGSPFRALGVVTPIDRIRPRYESLPEYGKVFPDPKTLPPRSREAGILEDAFAIIARHARPSVVSIEVTRAEDAETSIKGKRPMPGPDGKVQLVDYEIPRFEGPYSGVVLTADGQILTATANLWEFGKIEEIAVHLPDGRTLPGKVLGRDRFRGIALLAVEAKDLVPLPRAAEEDLAVGRFALAIGNPFGKGRQEWPLFTFGLVSGVHRLNPELDAIQTDAGMNDSMIGGALVTLEGELLGVNLLVNPEQYGRNSGVGFAVPLSALAETLPKLRAGQDAVPGVMKVRGLQPAPNGEGYVVQGVVGGGPAEKAGLKNGDLILEIDGRKAGEFRDPTELSLYIRAKGPGQVLRLKVEQKEGTKDLEVTLTAPDE